MYLNQIESNASAHSAPLSDDHKHQIREQKWDTLISLNLRRSRFSFFGLGRAFCCRRLFFANTRVSNLFLKSAEIGKSKIVLGNDVRKLHTKFGLIPRDGSW